MTNHFTELAEACYRECEQMDSGGIIETIAKYLEASSGSASAERCNPDFLETCLRNYAEILRSGQIDGAGHFYPEHIDEIADLLASKNPSSQSKTRLDLDILIDRLRVKVPASSQFQPLMDEAADAIEALRGNQSTRPQMTGDIEAAATAAIKAAQDEITIDRIESSDNHADMIRTAFIGAISSALLAERQRCADIASSEAIRRLNNEDGYPAARAHDFVVVARKIEREILPGPRDQSYRSGKRDRQRLQSAFKKGVKEGRRIEREAQQSHISAIAEQLTEADR